MALVRALIGRRSVNVSPEYAEAHDLEVLDEPTHLDDGRVRPETTATGRPIKPKTTLPAAKPPASSPKTTAAPAAAKKAAKPTATPNPPSEEN